MTFGTSNSQAVAFAIPTLAAVLSFVAYAATHHEGLDPAIVFPSMGLFQMLRCAFVSQLIKLFANKSFFRQPLMFLPRALSSLVDAKSGKPVCVIILDDMLSRAWLAFGRLKPVFLAETVKDQIHIAPDQRDALVVKNAEFVWFRQAGGAKKRKGDKQEKGEAEKKTEQAGNVKSIVFRVTDISLNIPRGSLVGIVGPVGCGKSSLLLGLLGEMPQTRGTVSFGGGTAYCSQMAWIQNATLVSNLVIFACA